MNGGENGGMINAETLKAQLDKMTKRVDTIIDALNNCGANTYGGALWSNIKTSLATITEKEDFSQITDVYGRGSAGGRPVHGKRVDGGGGHTDGAAFRGL